MAVLSFSTTLAVDTAVRLLALVGLAAGRFIPALPALRFSVAVASAPVELMPLAASLAFIVTAEPELAAMLMLAAAMSVIFTAAEVLKARFFVLRFRGPIAPEPLLKAMDVFPLMVALPVIVPDPLAVNVSIAPETGALMAMPLLSPLDVRDNVPPLVRLVLIVSAVAAAAVSVMLILAPVEAPLPVRA